MDDIYQEFIDANAILKGHFLLSSGLHSDTYIQCALALMEPSRCIKLCKALTHKITSQVKEPIDYVISPAMGGLIVGYEVARQLNIKFVFCERVEGQFVLKRGFEVKPQSSYLLIEDVITTGKSSLEVVDYVSARGGNIIAEGALIDRRTTDASILPFSLISLLKLEINNYTAETLPPHLQKLSPVKPGSRPNLVNY